MYQKIRTAIKTAKMIRIAASSGRSNAMFPASERRREVRSSLEEASEREKKSYSLQIWKEKEGEERKASAGSFRSFLNACFEGTYDVLGVGSGQDLDTSSVLSTDHAMNCLSFRCVLEHEEA